MMDADRAAVVAAGIGDTRQYIVCPFCHEEDFDQPGLAYHLDHYCEGIDAARAVFNLEGNTAP